jgi:HK97 gp10 family phage protein
MSLEDKLDKIIARVADELTEFTAEVAGDIRDEISTQYPPASAPGTPPHRRTGNLRASTFGLPAERAGDLLTGVVDNDAFYATYLENGTSRMAARPFFQPARDKWLPQWRDRAVGAAKNK